MIIESNLLEELYQDAGNVEKEKAQKYMEEKRVNITKVVYEDSRNFEIHAKVRGDEDTYEVYIQVRQGEIENVSCTCPDYRNHYAACKHVLATLMEFSENSEYLRIFAGDAKKDENDFTVYNQYQKKKQEEKYRTFKKLIHTFYPNNGPIKDVRGQEESIPHAIRIEPQLIYDVYHKILKLSVKIGDKQLYKLKDFPEFYERMLNKEFYRYGTKLAFVHEENAFAKESLPLLQYILKYAEIMKYANETGEYTIYTKHINDGYITISNSGLDDLFEILKGKRINLQKEYTETTILLQEKEPDIQFSVEKINQSEYRLVPNMDIYNYDLLEGKAYVYFLQADTLYRCQKTFQETVLSLLQIFRTNFTNEIVFPKAELSQLFSVVFPKIKEHIDLSKVEEKEIEAYIPEELYVKLFLDYDVNNHITADIQFVYGDIQFNPLAEEKVTVARDIVKEDEVLETFRKTGFLLDTAHQRLILIKEEAIYQFLAQEIENYMQKFEVLATQNFKEKEIKQPQISNLGVRIENQLLKVDFSQLDFDPAELKEIMENYKLKKKYHRLKDGSFLNLQENETMDLIDSLTAGMNVGFQEIKTGELKLPLYRSMYLERLLQNMKHTRVEKEENYQMLVNRVGEKQVGTNVIIPSSLQADLRYYQKVGFEWLKILDQYGLSGILADDMGLRKNHSSNYTIIGLCRKRAKSKAKYGY
ncbi:MAG: SNF2 helicase associated domain-containing protein [Clostridia bacterium]